MKRVTTITDLQGQLRPLRRKHRIALVPTMGALHPGHLSLVERASQLAPVVVVSIFVNPTQFDRPDDLDSYPRDLAQDEKRLKKLGSARPKLVFVPSVEEMYPESPRTTVHVAGVTDTLCGASRPGHFDGVATVVAKLLNIVQPDVAVFGRKDRQQLAVISQMAADLNAGVKIVGAPTVRDDDGVATSSRNLLLDDEQRTAARSLSRGLARAVTAVRQHRLDDEPVRPDGLISAVTTELKDAGARVDYVDVVHPGSFAAIREPIATGNRAVVAVAAFVGDVRLIDNVEIGDPADEQALLDAIHDTPQRRLRRRNNGDSLPDPAK